MTRQTDRCPLIRRSLIVSLLALAAVVGADTGPARAGCSDPGRPGVNWVGCFFDGRPMQGMSLTGGRLRDASFTRADVTGTDFSGADLRGAKFVSGKAEEAIFAEADLQSADFTRSKAARADFTGADLRRARFYRADLRGADFTGANLTGADLYDADLEGAVWVDGTTRCAEGSVGQCR
ncbi:MAG: hypothetical protein CMO30_26355 [Tistrella sp.]|uniref:Pentapeptide repeat-containing protein n=1 Tax=Tistrella mobilis TaxID=171437 RepID=A0A3B9IS39_9PROT|nr:pentapeptide repeat-containing protein [Tistrella sp.]MAD40726.1 hypothetical protein [Tistrella sp.]MBA78800.1 hypothetical protein [Tistrella sp.]HAE50615.1 pentapeptide repeat-containing protein [Tistrella mobilis]